jgi:transposase InsO family protein
MESILKGVYYNLDSPAVYSGINAVYREAKKLDPSIKLSDVLEFLQKQDTYTLHKGLLRNFKRKKTVAAGIDTDWQADLCDMQSLKKHNKGYAYILTVIDVLSKFAWAEPVKDKSPATVAKAFKKVLEVSGRKPWRLYTDKGWEFRGRPFQKLLDENYIQYLSSESPDVKASVAERFNRTLKSRLWKHFTTTKSYNYLDCLQDIVTSYNNNYHSSIKRKPVEVDRTNETEVRRILYGSPVQLDPPRKPVKFRFSVGDKVRIAKHKGVFEKGYLPNFTEEIFTIKYRLASDPPTYKIEDSGGEDISGVFYEPELVKVVKRDDIYKIEKVLKRRKRKGQVELFVKWLGYPEKFNQWIKESDLRTT